MESISSQVAWSEKRGGFDDKSFIVKLLALLFAIVILASYVLFQGFSTVEQLSSPFKPESFTSLKLESVEKKLNGNSVDLTVAASDFDGLADLDLSDIELMDTQAMPSADKVIPAAVKKTAAAKKPKAKKKIFISSQKMGSLSLIKKRFYASNNITFSLLLSQKFLEKKEYKKALKWALISNEINENNERSWILFAQAKAKLGKKQDAINALRVYLKSRNSIKVKKILDDIQKTS